MPPDGVLNRFEHTLPCSKFLKVGSQYAAQLRDVAKRVMPRQVYREFRLRVYPSNVATCTVSVLPRR